MASVGHWRAGKGSRTTVEGQNLKKSKWDITYSADDLDTNTFEGNGVDQGEIGILMIDWNLGGNWDAQLNALSDPPGLYPRSDLGDVKFYTSISDNVFWDLPNNRVLSSKNGAEVRGLVTFESSGKIQGSPINLPTGSV